MIRWKAALTLSGIFLAAILPPLLPAQSSDTSIEVPTLRLEVRRVPVDVVVLDKYGNPVKGLSKNDFLVKEDGVEQHLTAFDVVDGSKDSYIPPKLPTLPANTYINVPDTPERGPLYILYFDMTNMSQIEEMQFHGELLKFVDNAQPDMRMMLILNTDRLHILQGFTTDHELIKQAVLGNGPGPHIPQVFLYGSNYGQGDAYSALNNLNWIAEYMSGIPGRKNLLWMSGAFPIPVGPTIVDAGPAGMAGAAPSPGSVGNGGGPELLDLTELLKDTIKRTYSNMMKSQIALYPVDVGGVSGNIGMFEQMDIIAESTGGRAYYGNNFTHQLLDKAVEHGETYYALSYAPMKTDFDGSLRHIQVKLTKPCPDCQVTFRHAYYAVGDTDEDIDKQLKKNPVQARFLKEKAADTLFANMEHGAPMLHDLLFSTHLDTEGSPHMATAAEMLAIQDEAAYFKTRKPLTPVRMQKYIISYVVLDPELRRAVNAGQRPVLEFAVAVYNNEGSLMNSLINRGMPSGAGAPRNNVYFRAEQEIEAPEGATFFRMAVRDPATNRTGTFEVALPLKPPDKQVAQKQ